MKNIYYFLIGSIIVIFIIILFYRFNRRRQNPEIISNDLAIALALPGSRKVRLHTPSLSKRSTIVRIAKVSSDPVSFTLTMAFQEGLTLTSWLHLKLQTTKGPVTIRTAADTGSQKLLVPTSTCQNCDATGGTWPEDEPGKISGAEQNFNYGSAKFKGAYWTAGFIFGQQTVPIEIAGAESATPCSGQMPPNRPNACNPSICGLLPLQGPATSNDPSFIDELLGHVDIPPTIQLDYTKGKEKMTIGTLDFSGIKLPFLSISEVHSLFGQHVPRIPYYIVKNTGGTFYPDQGDPVAIKLPPYTILDSGTSISVVPSSYHNGAMNNIGGKTGVLTIKFTDPQGNNVDLSLRLGNQFVINNFMQPLKMFDNPPFNQLMIVGLSFMADSILTFSLIPESSDVPGSVTISN